MCQSVQTMITFLRMVKYNIVLIISFMVNLIFLEALIVHQGKTLLQEKKAAL